MKSSRPRMETDKCGSLLRRAILTRTTVGKAVRRVRVTNWPRRSFKICWPIRLNRRPPVAIKPRDKKLSRLSIANGLLII